MGFTANDQSVRPSQACLLGELSGHRLAINVCLSSGATICFGIIVKYLHRHILIILVETVAGNRLTAAAWTRLKVTTNHVQLTAAHSAIIALLVIQIVRTLTVRHAGKLL